MSNRAAPGSFRFRPGSLRRRWMPVIALIIEVVQDQLAFARKGKLRSVAAVPVSSDGEAIGTQCSRKGATSPD